MCVSILSKTIMLLFKILLENKDICNFVKNLVKRIAVPAAIRITKYVWYIHIIWYKSIHIIIYIVTHMIIIFILYIFLLAALRSARFARVSKGSESSKVIQALQP